MTDAISAVSSNTPTSSNTAATLSDDTKKQLQALGLDPSKYTSEAAAQQAITQAQSQQQEQGAQKSGGSSSFASMKSEVQDLASKMGVEVGNNDKIDDILSNISSKIDSLQANAGTDPTKLSDVNGYQAQYSTISAELSQMQAARNMTGASALANYNKAALGLAA